MKRGEAEAGSRERPGCPHSALPHPTPDTRARPQGITEEPRAGSSLSRSSRGPCDTDDSQSKHSWAQPCPLSGLNLTPAAVSTLILVTDSLSP